MLTRTIFYLLSINPARIFSSLYNFLYYSKTNKLRQIIFPILLSSQLTISISQTPNFTSPILQECFHHFDDDD